MSLACWSYFIKEQGACVLLEIMGVMAHLPCYLAALGGSTLWTYGLGPHLQ
jgi:hypothetical protein